MKKLTFWKSLFLLCALIVGSSSVWADESTWTWTAASANDLGTTSTTSGSSADVTLNGKSWTSERKLISGDSYTGFTSNCIQLGKNGGVDNVTLTTSAFSGNVIKSVAVECSSYQGKHKVAIKVGSSTYLSATATSSWTTVSTKTGTGTSQGDIEIKFTDGTRALYIKSITVKYEPASTDPAINTSSNVDITADDTSGEIPFTISNPVANTHLTATITAGNTWLSNATVDETNGKVTFVSTVNEDMENSREGTIHLVYGDNLVSKDITITQAAMPAKYSVTYTTAQTNGTLTIKNGDEVVPESGAKFPEGTVLTIVTTPDENYAFRNWQYRREGGNWVSNTAATTYTMTDKNVEFQANFDPTLPVNFSVNGQIASTARFANGKKITFPESVTSFGGYMFMGWAETAIDGSATVKPTLVDTSNETMGTEEQTYYAVYAKTTALKATFDPNDITDTPLTDDLTWTHTDSGIELYISSGQLYTGTPKTFTTNSGTSNYMEIRRDDAMLRKVTLTVSTSSNTTYNPNKWALYEKVEDTSGTTVTSSVSGSNPYTLNITGSYESLACFPTSNKQIRATKVEVEAEVLNDDYCTTIPPIAVTITDLSKVTGSSYTGKNYATMYYSDRALAVPAGVLAKTYKMVSGVLTESRTYENGGTYPVIPAGEAVVLESDAGANYSFAASSTETTPDEDNALRGTDVATTVDADGFKYYKLAMNDGLDKVGFFFDNADGSAINNGAHKAYLRVAANTEAKNFYLFGEDATTGIANLNVNDNLDVNAPMYNLAGQRVNKSYKGVVIVNGKKMLNK